MLRGRHARRGTSFPPPTLFFTITCFFAIAYEAAEKRKLKQLTQMSPFVRVMHCLSNTFSWVEFYKCLFLN